MNQADADFTEEVTSPQADAVGYVNMMPGGSQGETQNDNAALERLESIESREDLDQFSADFLAGKLDAPEAIGEGEVSGHYHHEEHPPMDESAGTDASDASDEAREKPYRLRPRSELGRRAFEMMRQDIYLSEEDAFAAAREELEVSSTDAGDSRAGYGDTPNDSPSLTDESSEAIRQRIDELEDQIIEATAQYQLDEAADLQREMRRLRRDVLPQVERYESSMVESWNRSATDSLQTVAAKYPQSTDPNSAFAARMREIDGIWHEIGDDRYYDPTKAEMIAELVAREQGIAPARKDGRSTPVTASTYQQSSAQRPQTPHAIYPSPGSARSDVEDPRSSLSRRLDEATSMYQLDALEAEILGNR